MITIVKFTAILAIAAILALSPFMTMTLLWLFVTVGIENTLKSARTVREMSCDAL